MDTEANRLRGLPEPGRDGTHPSDRPIAGEIRGMDDPTDPFVAAAHATRMPTITTDPRQFDNPVVFADDEFCRLPGDERAEILGLNCRFPQDADTDPQTVRRIREAVASCRPIEIDIRNRRKNGDPFRNRLLMAPVFDAEGRLACFFANQVDVSPAPKRPAGLRTADAASMSA